MLHDVYKPNRHWKDIELWKDVTEEQWNDWVWQLTNTIKTLDDLKKVINLTPDEEEGVKISTKTIPLNITPYYAWLMNPDDHAVRFGCNLYRSRKSYIKQNMI